jgi:hypothetical protein
MDSKKARISMYIICTCLAAIGVIGITLYVKSQRAHRNHQIQSIEKVGRMTFSR